MFVATFDRAEVSRKTSSVLALLILALTVSIVLKAVWTPLTYDEAYTFFAYPGGKDIFDVSLANNHPLNSALLQVTTALGGRSELAIRFPNVVAGAAYLALAAAVANSTESPILSFSLLAFNPYLLEFFSLARGYGIATCFVLLALYVYFFARPRFAFLYGCVALVAASFAIYIVVVLLAIFILVAGCREWRKTDTLSRRALVAGVAAVCIAAIFPAWATLEVTVPGKPLVGETVGDALMLLRGFLTMYYSEWTLGSDRGARVFLVGVAFFLPLVGFIWFSRRTWMLLGITVLGFTALYGLPALTGRPWPVGRVLLPFVPPLLLASISAWDDVLRRLTFLRVGVPIAVFAWMAGNMLSTYAIDRTRDWESNKVLPELVRDAVVRQQCIAKRPENLAFVYYEEAFAKKMNLPKLTICPN